MRLFLYGWMVGTAEVLSQFVQYGRVHKRYLEKAQWGSVMGVRDRRDSRLPNKAVARQQKLMLSHTLVKPHTNHVLSSNILLYAVVITACARARYFLPSSIESSQSPALTLQNMLQPRMAFRAIRLPFRCLPSTPSRGYAAEVMKAKETPPDDPVGVFAPPPTRGDNKVHLRTYTPRTPGVRHLRRPVNDHLWKGRPVHKLTFPKRGHAKGGRNNTGKVTVRHHGGGHKRRIRTVDFLRMAPGPHLVERIEYDPNRSAHIALVRGKKTRILSYILAADGMRAGDVVQSYMSGIPKELWDSMGGTVDPGVLAARTAWRGNCLPLHMIPVGSLIFNVGLRPGKGGQLCRSAGTYATVVAKEQVADTETEEGETKKKPMTQPERQKQERMAQHITIRLQSGEVRLLHRDCCATIGVSSNPNYHYTQLGKAGRARWRNVRPTVRGVAMNAADHPHGGGRGKSKGNVHPKSPWGIPVCISVVGHLWIDPLTVNHP